MDIHEIPGGVTSEAVLKALFDALDDKDDRVQGMGGEESRLLGLDPCG